ncbi:MAG: response regulator transcription factor [Actinomycetota bacterium]|nr:response regulator transcription factor [Actinomycetota bacterium]
MRVVIAEDSVLLREGITRVLAEAGFDVAAQVDNADDLLEAIETHAPDLVVTDIKMPPSNTDDGLRAAQTIKQRWPHIPVLVLSQYIEPGYAEYLMGLGPGLGYLLKDRVAHIDEFVASLRRLVAGESVVDPKVAATLLDRGRRADPVDSLTDREREILGLMAQGHSNASLSEMLFLSPKTLEKHVGSIFLKLDLPPESDGHRRVLAVLAFLGSPT